MRPPGACCPPRHDRSGREARPSSAINATEDEVLRRLARSGRDFVFQQPSSLARTLVLTLDGSTRVCSAALLAASGPGATGVRVLAERADVDSRGQAKVLLRMVDDMMGETGHEPADLGAIVVGIGPGTFTGVRIAVATARALSLALAIPVTGISTLSSLAVEAAAQAPAAGAVGESHAGPALLVPVVDARRGQLFFGVYRKQVGVDKWARSAPFTVCDKDGLAGVLEAEEPQATEPRSGRSAPLPRALVAAEERELVGVLPPGVDFLQAPVRAERLVLGQDKLREPGDGPDGARLAAWLAGALAGAAEAVPETVKPIYVRSPDADIHITKMKDPRADAPAPDGRGRR